MAGEFKGEDPEERKISSLYERFLGWKSRNFPDMVSPLPVSAPLKDVWFEDGEDGSRLLTGFSGKERIILGSWVSKEDAKRYSWEIIKSWTRTESPEEADLFFALGGF